MKNVLIVLVAGCAFLNPWCAPSYAADPPTNWPQWRGPDASGVAADANPPMRWSESENIQWKVEIPGAGSATPIVFNDRIYLLTAIKTDREAAPAESTAPADLPSPAARGRRGFGGESNPTNVYQFVVLCLDLQTGRQIWQRVANESIPHEGHHATGSFASCSPITDGTHIYASFGSRGIYAYDMDGNLKWSQDLGDMRCRNGFGEGGSPALSGDSLLVPWDHEDQSFLFSLNTGTGKIQWQVERDEPTAWGTPLVVDWNDRTQVILNGTNRVRSYDLRDGSLIWECGGPAFNPVASPVHTDHLVYCTVGRRSFVTTAMPLAAVGDITDTDEIAWRRTDSGAYVASPVIYNGSLYHIKGTSAIVSSIDAESGEVIFGPSRLPGLRDIYASPVASAGRIYFTDRHGATTVLQHGPELEVLSTNQLDEGSDASLVLIGEQILLRGSKHLYCIGEAERP